MPVAKAPVLNDSLTTTPTHVLSLPSPFALPATSTSPLSAWSGVSGASAIAFIDASVPDYQTLVAGMAPGTEVHLLDSSQDAITQITNTLLGRHNISSLHIVSHGEAGGLDFGSSVLNLTDLPQYAAQLQSWSKALTDDADLLLYGCNVAAGELGKAFVQILSQLTGADVAASDDLTGSASKGGNWTLEYQTGAINATPFVQEWFLQAYDQTLAAFTPGNLAVYRVGDGSTAPSSAGTQVFLDEYTTTGTLVQSIALPTTVSGSNRRLVASGTATSEGFLNRSTDGQYLTLTGYDAAVGTASVASTASATTNRVVGRVDAAGNSDTSTALTDGASGSNLRSAVSTNGTDLWVTGGAGGVRYTTLGATTSTQLSTTVTNLRNVNIFDGQLYVSSQSGSTRLATVGTGTPTTAGQTITNLPGFPTSSGSPNSFFFVDLTPTVAGVDTLYVADTTATAESIQKYSLVSGSWVSNGQISAGILQGLTASVSGTNVSLFATGTSQLRSFTDTSGYNSSLSGTFSTIATAATNTAFRGVALAPAASLPTVSLATATPSLSEGNTGTFTIGRGSNTTGALTVNLTIDGTSTAILGSSNDYTLDVGGTPVTVTGNTLSVTIPDTQSAVTLNMVALVEALGVAEAADTLKLNLATGTGYTVGSSNTATITIAQNGFTVTTTSDTGEGSLRQAVLNANAIAGADTITFGGSTFTDTTPNTITLTSGLTLTGNTTITGTGANLLTVTESSGDAIVTINAGATVNLSQLTIDSPNNHSYVVVNNGTASLDQLTFAGNNSESSHVYNTGTIASVTNSTFNGSGSSGSFGILNLSTIALISNSTFSGNDVGIYNLISGSTITTIVNNTIAGGSSILNDGTITNLYNNLLIDGGNSALGTVTNSGNNLIGTFAALGVDSTLRDNGGTTQTYALLPGSTAINAGTNTSAPIADQRGISRVGAVDIGAFESRGFTVSITDGNNQSTQVNTAFTNPLTVNVSSAFSEPVAGGKITYTPSGSEANATFSSNPATIDSSGNASATATANSTAGSYTATAGGSGIATPASFNLTNTPPNASPTLTLAGTPLSYTENDPATLIDSTATVVDSDSANFDTGTLTVNYSANGTVDDRLAIRNQGTSTGQIGVSGSTVTYGGTTIGTFTGGTGTTALVITFNASATPAAVTALLQNLTYANVSEAPSTAARTVQFVVTDGDGGTSTAATKTINVTAVDDTQFFVTNTNDSGTGSLRQAILDANADPGAETITFIGSTFTDATPDTITLTSGELAISSDITLTGTGANLLTLSGNNASRVFNISSGVVGMSGVAIANGNAGAANGGGIFNAGSLTLTNSIVRNNAGNLGGGLLSSGTLNLTNVTVSGNTAVEGGGVNANNGVMTITNSTISGNTSTGNGGGIMNISATTTSTITNSTISGNTGASGGGIRNTTNATLTLSNVTIANNTATAAGGGISRGSGTVNVKNTLIAGNTHASSPDVNGTFVDQGNSLIGKSNGSTSFTNGANGNLVGTIAAPINPLLAPLANNGGATQTHALLPGSLAINAGTSTGAPTADQRGISRVGAVDIGAFESRGFTIATTTGTPQSTVKNTAFGTPLAVTISSAFGETVNGGVITFTAPGTGASTAVTTQTATIASSQASVTATANNSSGNYSVTASANGITSPATFSLTNTNTAPIVTNVSKTGTEDTTVSFSSADFTNQFSDANSDSLSKIQITSLPTQGTLKLGGSTVTLNQEITAAQLATLTYSPSPNSNGSNGTDSFGWNGSDGTDYAATGATVTINVAAVNDAPSFTKGSDQTSNEDAGAQTINSWATNIAAGPADESGQTLTFLVSNNNNALFTVQPTIDPTGKLTYTSAADANGTATVTVQLQDNGGTANGGVDTTAAQTFTIAVNAVNDAPTFTQGGNQTITAGAGVQTSPNWATGFNPGPANEASQTVQAYQIVSNDHAEIFAVAPAIDTFGNLTYTPVTNLATVTTATIGVQVQDSGGTANGGIDTATVQTFTITVKPQPTLSITPVTHAEGNSGTTPYTFTVNLSDTSTQTVSVNYATADSTATVADGDYTGVSGNLTFAPGETSKTFTVNVNGDTKYEPTETFAVNLSSAVNGAIAQGSNTVNGTIGNDDSVPVVNITPTVTHAEGNSGTTPYTYTVTLSNASAAAIGINYTTSDGSATVADGDYTAVSGILTFAPGDTSKTITVNANGDTKFEPDETFQVLLSAANGSGAVNPGTTTGTATITNDDTQPTISIGNVSQNEGNSGTTAYTFTVTLSNASAQTVAVNYATADGTATVADNDYTAASGTLSFAPSETSKTITVLVKGDTKFEANQAFSVGLSNASNGTLNTSTGTGTIVNDDSRPTLSSNSVSNPEGRSGNTPFTFTVSLSNTSDETVTVNYATANGTATTADNDYTAASGTLTFNPADTSQTLTVNAIGDKRREADETFQVTLTTPTNGTIASNGGTGTGTIANDDVVTFVWRNATTNTPASGSGENSLWQVNGFSYQTFNYLPSVTDLNWQIVGTADFNSDGTQDLLWRHRVNGENIIWLLNGTTVQSTYALPTVNDANWQIVGIGDFNGDTKADLLWRNRANGQDIIWQVNGTTVQSTVSLPTVADANWQIVGTADFNHDGTADMLWRNKVNGDNILWQMNNFSRQSLYTLPSVADANWQIVGTADFNNDGSADILWRNQANGQNILWQTNNFSRQSVYTLPTVNDANWQIQGTADFDGDGSPDLVWRNQQNGQDIIWQLTGFTYAQSYQLPTVAAPWHNRVLESAVAQPIVL